MKNYKSDKFLYLILFVAFLFRLPGIIDGLPAVYNSTEHFLARMVLSMGASKTIDPGFYIYPTFYTYFLFFLFGCLFLIGTLSGIYGSQYDFAVQFLTNPSLLYIVSRSVNVCISILTIFIIYSFLKRHTNITTAKIATVITAFSFYLIRFSSYATADTLMIFFSTLTILYIYKVAESNSIRDFFFTGVFCGLAIAAKYNAGFLIIGLMVLIIQKWRINKNILFPALGISIGGILTGFFSTNPLWLIYPERFYQGLRVVSSQMYNAVSAERGNYFIWEISQLIQHEMVLGILFIVATVYFIFHKDQKHYPVLLFLLLTFFYVGTWTKKGIDYLFAVFPVWIILGAIFLERFQHKYLKTGSSKRIALVIIFLPSLASGIHQFIQYTNQDTREEATEWIIDHIHKKQAVCYDNYHNDLGVFDIERYISYGASAEIIPDGVKEKLLAFSENARQIHFIPIVVENTDNSIQTENAYEEIALKYKRRDLEELIKLGTSFLITNSWYMNSYLTIDMEDYPPGVQVDIKEVQAFYKNLNKYYSPMIEFSPSFWTAGPKINIYDLRSRRHIDK